MTRQDSGVDQLIERVKSEGIEKAERARDDILKKAEADAKAMLDAARAKSEAYIEEAKAYIAKEKRKLAAELELSARDFSIKLTERMKEQMFFPAIKETVRITFKEPDFLKEVLERLIIEYVKTSPCNLDVLVPKELKTTLATFFAGAIHDRLDKNCDIRLLDEDGIEGFAILKRGEHYVWDFRVETVSEELMRLVEPSLRKYFVTTSRTVGETLKPVLVSTHA